ncbi:methyltransferase [Streptomyces sp. NPDC052496]|uniref:methyltransferase n=1 Tax=Streptomyces sp. NPDC052496 TaxID=3154951 RepID=UPI00341B21F7
MPTHTETIRAAYAAFHRRDLDGVLAFFATDILWTHPDGMDAYGLGGTKKGHREVREFMARVPGVFSEMRPEPEEFIESGDRVAVFGRHHMRGARSGVGGTVKFVHSWRIVDGKATHFEDYFDSTQVLQLLEAPAAAGDERPAAGDATAGRPTTGSRDAASAGSAGDPAGAAVAPVGSAADPVGDILRTGLGFWNSKVLMSACELGVFTELARAGQPLDAGELRTRIGIHPRGALDFFDALVSMNLLDREAGRYRNTATADAVLDSGKPEHYVGAILEFISEHDYAPWGQLTEALRTGEPQTNVPEDGSDPFEELYADPERLRRFQRAMTSGSLPTITALAEAFDWSRHHSVADIGCSEGALLAHVLRAHPHLSGTGFDLPPVGPTVDETVAAAGLGDRMTFVPGSFLTDELPRADVLVFSQILHDWDLDTKRMLLRKAYDALPDGGAVVIADALIDDERRHNTFGLLMSLHMLVQSPGGFDYTGADGIGWLREAGFRDCRVQPLPGPRSLVVGVK